MKHILLILPAALSLGALTGCDQTASAEQKNSTPPVPTSVRILHPEPGEITRSITLPGNIHAWQETMIYAKVSGYLNAIHADIGDTVKKGDLLAEIEAPEMLADRIKAEVEVKVAEKDYLRVSEARAKASDLVMPQNVDDAKARFDVKKAELDRLDTLLSYARITAPFDGIVTLRNADPGAFIPAATGSSSVENAALIHLSDFRKVRIEIDVPEVEVSLLKTGLAARIHCHSLADMGTTGTVTRLGYALNPRTKTMKAEVEIENPGLALRPGMMASVKIDFDRRENVLLLPATALIIEKGKTFVFVVRDGKAVRTPVTTGFDDGKSIEITGGVTTSDNIIDAGKQKVSDGQMVTSLPTEK